MLLLQEDWIINNFYDNKLKTKYKRVLYLSQALLCKIMNIFKNTTLFTKVENKTMIDYEKLEENKEYISFKISTTQLLQMELSFESTE
jgi:hypothetical protein